MKILIGITEKVGLNQINEVTTPAKNPKHCGHFIQYPKKFGLILIRYSLIDLKILLFVTINVNPILTNMYINNAGIRWNNERQVLEKIFSYHFLFGIYKISSDRISFNLSYLT